MNQFNPSQNADRRQWALNEADRRWDETADRLKYSTEYAQTGLKGLFLSNGAAIIALLTFVGHSQAIVTPDKMFWPFGFFAIGLAAVLCAYLAAYLSQECLMNAAYSECRKAESTAYETGIEYDISKYENRGTWAVRIGLACAVISLLGFVAGAFAALNAMT